MILNEYYQESDDSKVYLVASVLDPHVKLRYFELNWKHEWLIDIHKKLDKYLEEFTAAMGIDSQGTERGVDQEMNDSQKV